jgi:hypothetical protein
MNVEQKEKKKAQTIETIGLIDHAGVSKQEK